MPSLLAYIVQVNILLAVVYVGYILLLKNLTFYQLNRVYFLSGAFFAFVYPFFDIKALFERHIEPVGELIGLLPNLSLVQEEAVYTLENLVYLLISVGGIVLVLKFVLQLLSLLRIHLHSVDATWKKYLYRNVLFPIVPFSFLNKIYVSKEQHQELELQDIFEHEDVHVKGCHTLDILSFELVLIVCWYNPFVWLMRKAVRQNLEFLTDQQVLKKGVDRQTYQYSLLHVSKHGASVAISNQFNFKLLKRRIMMMNRKKSSKIELSKYAFLLPIIIFSAGAFTVSRADDHIVEVVNIVKETEIADLQGIVQKAERIVLEDTVDEEELELEILDTTEGLEKESVLEVVGMVGNATAADTTTTIKLEVVNRGFDGLSKPLKAPFNEPLVIVDGEMQALGYNLNEINADNIVSINILKDKATIGFGEQGKHGVIKVTTKEGTGGLHIPDLFGNIDTAKAKKAEIMAINEIHQKGKDVLEGLKLKKTTALGKSPLYVLDGKIMDQLPSNLDPKKIERISVLRDANATALYGKKGANGVVIVTTKANGSQEKKLVWKNSPEGKKLEWQGVLTEFNKGKGSLAALNDQIAANDPLFYNMRDGESLKRFLDLNRANIDLKGDVVLVINGKVATESDLKKIKATEVLQVGAIDLTDRNSNLPENLIGVLFLKDGNTRKNNGASAGVYNTKKRIDLVIDPQKNSAPFISRK